MEPEVFKYSEGMLKAKKKIMLLAALFLPLTMFMFAYFIPKITYPIALFALFAIEALIFFQSRTMLKQLRNTKIVISNEMIERHNGSFKETYAFKDLKEVLIKQDNSKNTISISLKGNKQNAVFAGFQSMNLLSDFFVNRVPSERISFKETAPTQINLTILTLVTALTTTIIIISLYRVSEYTYEFFSNIIQMFLGLYLLLFAPISKSAGIRYRKFEKIGGSALAIIGTALIISNWFGA